MEEEKGKKIKRELAKLKKIYSKLDDKRKNTIQRLIENAAFMAVTLEDLQRTINTNGVVDEYKNGENQYGTKKSPEVEIYNTMIKNYSAIIRQLTELLPKEEMGDEDGFDEFINDR